MKTLAKYFGLAVGH